MYTEPKIVLPQNLQARAYINFYFNGKRIRIYNGKILNLNIYPNNSQSLKDRKRLLNILLFELKDVLRKNIFLTEEKETKHLSIIVALENALNSKLHSGLSSTYKRDLKTVFQQFMAFLDENEKSGSMDTIKANRIEAFLANYESSGTYYMNKRRNLAVLFSAAGRLIEQPNTTVTKTSKRKANSKLHKIYEPAQLKAVLAYLKLNHEHCKSSA